MAKKDKKVTTSLTLKKEQPLNLVDMEFNIERDGRVWNTTKLERTRRENTTSYINAVRALYNGVFKTGTAKTEVRLNSFYDHAYTITERILETINEPEEKVKFLDAISRYPLRGIGAEISDEISQRFSEAINGHKLLIASSYQDEDLPANENEGIPETVIDTTAQIEPIKWEKNQNQLLYLFDLLYKHHFISASIYEKRATFITNHFSKSDGKTFLKRNLQTLIRELEQNKSHPGKPRDHNTLEDIVSKMSSTESNSSEE